MTLRVGFHVSIAGGIQNSITNALDIGCTAFQIFTRSPRQWQSKDLVETDVELFKTNLKKSGIEKNSVAVHMPYLPNLSGPDGELFEKSLSSFTSELIRCSQLGIEFLVIHLGSHKDMGRDHGVKQLLKSCGEAVDKYKSTFKKNLDVTILLENSAGQKGSIGSKLEELGEILDKLSSKSFCVCLDTCHAFASGYDLSTEEACKGFISEFDDTVGLESLKFIHLNDSKYEIGSHLDRHELFGHGKIGSKGLSTIINDKKMGNVPMVMEPEFVSIEEDAKNLALIRKLRKQPS
ncbi:MAG TPA: deoxyribonuclease IV [Nitrososphaeraceae archaeon]|nr:deoxyribonuclease IV [Nitrososphaeraceae archaeon]